MFSEEELKLAFAVVAAAALMKEETPGFTRVLCARPGCAGAGGVAAGTTGPNVTREDCGQPPEPVAGAPGPGPGPLGAAAWPTPAVKAARRRARGEGARTCVVFAVDIAGFTDAGRDDEVQLALRRALYALLAEAFEASGVSWAECVHEDRGDGVVVVLPEAFPAVVLIDPLLHRLRAALRRHNRMASEVARIGLRVAVHMGQVHRDDHGLAGTAVNHLFRLLDAPVLRAALAAAGSELALIVSDHYYECVVRQRPSMTESAAFRPVAIKVKQTRDHGWIWTPPVVLDAGRAVAVRWWMMPVGAICSLLWGGGAALIAAAGVDPSPLGGLALGVVVITGIVMVVITTALVLQARLGPRARAASRVPRSEPSGA
ncbi:MAG TPA: hypothetical protein VFU43_28565 [Streptosporangiaceae bacterium]|nr:hypothetical protein [Streptosporangiaceae bacterium]